MAAAEVPSSALSGTFTHPASLPLRRTGEGESFLGLLMLPAWLQSNTLIYPISLCKMGPFLPPRAGEDAKLRPELFDQVCQAWLLSWWRGGGWDGFGALAHRRHLMTEA